MSCVLYSKQSPVHRSPKPPARVCNLQMHQRSPIIPMRGLNWVLLFLLWKNKSIANSCLENKPLEIAKGAIAFCIQVKPRGHWLVLEFLPCNKGGCQPSIPAIWPDTWQLAWGLSTHFLFLRQKRGRDMLFSTWRVFCLSALMD